MRSWFLALVVALAVAAAAPAAHADDERPPTSHLVWAGLGMAIPTYVIGVVAHEGSHALAARLSGAEVRHMSLVPGFHPRTGKFYFGYVEAFGLRCDRQRASFLLAPKLTDALLLGGFSLAYFAGAQPDDHYGRLALTVLATGFWVDFSKDVFAFWDHNDTVKVYNLMGADRELERLPLRLLHAGLAAAGAIAIAKSYQGIFDDGDGTAPAALVPLMVGSF